MSPAVEIQLIAVLVAVACSLPGTFLVLRRMAMLSDAISHAILPGLVVGFFLTQDLNSPLLMIGAAATGVLTVALVEALERTRLVREDAAIGLVFPALFSIGVILIARFAGDVHLDTDAVLLGELAFAPFDRLVAAGYDLGPRSLWTAAALVVLNTLFVAIFFKELKITTFDAGLAAALGFLPGVLHYALMGIVSLTTVGAFDAVGSVLVIALLVGPPATARLLTDRLGTMIGVAASLGAACAVGGYWLARLLDASIAGSIATVVGVAFGAAFLAAPGTGLLSDWRRRRQQRYTFAGQMLLVHLAVHAGTSREAWESRAAHLEEHFGWSREFASEVVRGCRQAGVVRVERGLLVLTDAGRAEARRVLRTEPATA